MAKPDRAVLSSSKPSRSWQGTQGQDHQIPPLELVRKRMIEALGRDDYDGYLYWREFMSDRATNADNTEKV
jgi:hypothetical protein